MSELTPDITCKQLLVVLLNLFLGRDKLEDLDQLYDEKNEAIIHSEKY